MLSDLLEGQEKSQFILITDVVGCCGRLLLLNSSLKCLQRDDFVVLVCLERPPSFFTNWLPSNLQQRLKCVDGFKPKSKGESITDEISNAVSSCPEPCAVIFDSLTPFLIDKDTPSLCRFLHKLNSYEHVSQMITLFHRDVHDEGVFNLIRYLAASVVELSRGSKEDYVCHVRHCRPTGKLFDTTESVYLDDSLCIQRIQPLGHKTKGKTEIIQNEEATQQADPTSNLTFNLSLTDSEKEARSQVVLPYMKEKQNDEPVIPQSGGRILYQPDEADDLDEEDPDDDLNI